MFLSLSKAVVAKLAANSAVYALTKKTILSTCIQVYARMHKKYALVPRPIVLPAFQ